MDRLRNLSVSVEEPAPGQFHWVLSLNLEDATVWTQLYASEAPYDMWIDALKAGVAALLKIVSDERIGPREPGKDEDADPVASTWTARAAQPP